MSVLTALMGTRASRTNLMVLVRLTAVLIGLITTYSIVFHVLMEREGQHHSWVTGFYWTLTVMSTLGFGDITFESDAGRLFSIIVLVTGVLFLLVLLPFTFIEFFYAPWMKAQEKAKAPLKVPSGTEGHIIFTHYGPVASMLSRMLEEYAYPWFVVVPTLEQALDLRDRGVPVVMGDRSDPESYRRLKVEQAAMVVTTLDDVTNANVCFTVRELSDSVPIVASASSEMVRSALELAGVTHILRLEEMMGQTLARRVIGNDAAAHTIGDIEGLIIAEASAAHTPLVGKTVAESDLRGQTGVTIVGLWSRGKFKPVDPDTKIREHSVLVMAGSRQHFDQYDRLFGKRDGKAPARVVIAGGGRVGRATAQALTEAGIHWTLIEKLPERVRHLPNTVIGDASDFDVLVKAGLHQAASVIVTTHDDDVNAFLTIFFRRLRNNMQIICRCTQESNAARLHRAGADVTLSYASMGANTIFNLLRSSDTVLLAEGVNIFSVSVPSCLAGMTLADSAVRSRTGCSVLAVEVAGNRQVNPDPFEPLPDEGRLVLIGTLEAERKFLEVFKPSLAS
ncbi:potassium transporter [Haloferula helveola]|uniref:Potassium transporter n=1 Tax=Haloferula helveola TaxID=490095 RepID=A0ABM7RKN9_9BACT|nr:potassium transporter [Haloferula helveola]